MAFTPSKTDAVPPKAFEVSPPPSTVQAAPQTPRAAPRTPTRLTRYDPSASGESPDLVRPATAPARPQWPMHPLGSPIDAFDLEIDDGDWPALEQIARAFDLAEMPTFNSIFYRQKLTELGIPENSHWEALLLHLGLQHETLWIDRLYNFQEDCEAKAAKQTAARVAVQKQTNFTLFLAATYFNKWYNAGVLKMKLESVLQVSRTAAFADWREKAVNFTNRAGDFVKYRESSLKRAAIAGWRRRLQAVDQGDKAENFDRRRLARSALAAVRHRAAGLVAAQAKFRADRLHEATQAWQQRRRDETATRSLVKARQHIHLRAWHARLEKVRRQLDFAEHRGGQRAAEEWTAVWRAALHRIYANDTAAAADYDRRLVEQHFVMWRRSLELAERARPLQRRVDTREARELLSALRQTTDMHREAARFRLFFAGHAALVVWRLAARERLFSGDVARQRAATQFQAWRARTRLAAWTSAKSGGVLQQTFADWRQAAKIEQRRERALAHRARQLALRFAFAQVCRRAADRQLHRTRQEAAAAEFYQQHARSRCWRRLRGAAADRRRALAAAGEQAAHSAQHRVLKHWQQAFEEARDEQFGEIERVAARRHAASLAAQALAAWRRRARAILEAQQVSELVLAHKYVELWSAKRVAAQDRLAAAAAWRTASVRRAGLRRWQGALRDVRQNQEELELWEGGRAIEKTRSLLEQWQTAAQLAQDRAELVARREPHFQRLMLRRQFRQWRARAGRSEASPQTPLRTERVLQPSTVRQFLARRSGGRVASTGSPIASRTLFS